MTTAPASPSTGSVARTRLAGDAATTLGRLRVPGRARGAPAEIPAVRPSPRPRPVVAG